MKQAAGLSVGVDLGGTKIEIAALDGDGDILLRSRTPTPSGYRETIAAVAELVAQVEKEAGPAAHVGVGIPGSLSPRTGLVRNANHLCLNGRRFQDDLSRGLNRPVLVANDANCLALSEAMDGAGAGAETVLAIILGTGCGGGVVVDGAVLRGANGIAGEWGHNPLPNPTPDESPGPGCWCGRRNCVETWIAGSGLERCYRERTGQALTAEQIVGAMRRGEQVASELFDRWVERVSRSLSTVINILDPQVIVVGGGLANVSELYSRVPRALGTHVFADGWTARVRPAKWGDSSDRKSVV